MNTPFFISFRTLRADLTGAFQVIFRQGDPGAGPQGRTLKSPLSTAQQALPPGKGCFMLVKGQAGDGWNTKTTPLLGTKYALNCLRMRRMVSSYSKRAQKKGAFCLYSQLKFLSRHAECKQIEVPVRGSISMSGGCEGMRVWRGIVSFDGHKLPVGWKILIHWALLHRTSHMKALGSTDWSHSLCSTWCIPIFTSYRTPAVGGTFPLDSSDFPTPQASKYHTLYIYIYKYNIHIYTPLWLLPQV